MISFLEEDFAVDCMFLDVYPRIVSWTTDSRSYGSYIIRAAVTSRQETQYDDTIYHPSLQISKEVSVQGEASIIENLNAAQLDLAYSLSDAVYVINASLPQILSESKDSFDSELSSSIFEDDYRYI